MFYVCATVYEILQKNGCTIYEGAKELCERRQEIDDPTEIVRLFHRMPDNSEMLVYDPSNRNSYRFSKGEPLKYETDADIDQFIHDYIY